MGVLLNKNSDEENSDDSDEGNSDEKIPMKKNKYINLFLENIRNLIFGLCKFSPEI